MSYILTYSGSVTSYHQGMIKKAEACWTLDFSYLFSKVHELLGLHNVSIHVSAVVFFSFLAPDQWPLPVLQLSCNYTTVCDVWVFKRSNTVSILSQGTDLRGVSCRYKRSLAVFWCHTIVFCFFFVPASIFFSVTSYFHVWGMRQ